MRVSLITTGAMELLGLADMLKQLFPAHEFYAEPSSPGVPFNGFTSAKVQLLGPTDPPGKAALLVRAALGTLVVSAGERPADLSVILEDVELLNKGAERTIIEHLHQSANRVLGELRPPADPVAVRALMRTRISFHLAAPMPESWFFGDVAALEPEVPPARLPPRVTPGQDLEDFLTADPAYAADTGASCTAWIAAGSPSVRRPPWLISRRTEHPKAYLAWLLRDPSAADSTRYKESREGVRLLKRLEWGRVLTNPDWFTYARALIRDLEAALGVRAVGVPAGGVEAPLTSLYTVRAAPILRNL